MPSIEHDFLLAHPQIIAVDTLAHALQATRRAIASAHPEIGDALDLGDVDRATHLALLIALDIIDFDELLTKYRAALETDWASSFEGNLPF